jgi:hypothetical protein
LDFRGTLGVSKEVPVGFKAIRLSFILDCDATAVQIQNIARLTDSTTCDRLQSIILFTCIIKPLLERLISDVQQLQKL